MLDATSADRWNAFVLEAARLVAEDGCAVERIRRRHVRGRRGACTECGHGVAWPCVHLAIANRAVRLRRGG